MIFTEYYKLEKLPEIKAKSRYDVTIKNGEHDYLEAIMLNKRNPLKGGLSLNLVHRVENWGGKEKTDRAITKGSSNISSIYIPDPTINIGYGDIYKTNDALIFVFNDETGGNTNEGVKTIELLIARGQKHNVRNLYYLFCDGELNHELNFFRQNAMVTKSVTGSD